ncbi:hypothetical protein MAHJHV47_46520 [Mycobacterium avium subsp. hominissuis]
MRSNCTTSGLRLAGTSPVSPGTCRWPTITPTGGVVTPPLDDLQNDDLVPYRTLVTTPPVGSG